MSRDTLILIELLLVLGGVMGWAVWELWRTKRVLREDEERRALARREEGSGE